MSGNDEIKFDDIVNASSSITVDLANLGGSVSTKRSEREEIDRQIEAFLNAGGTIDVIEANVLADPPRKPVNNYGSQPI